MTKQDVPAPRVAPGMLLRMAVWFGVLTGFSELGYLAYKKYVSGLFVWVSRDALWMAPLGDTAYAALVALVVLVVGRFKPRLRTGVFALSWLGLLCFALQFDGLHPLAAVALSAGIAFQLSKWANKRATGFTHLVRRTAPLLVVIAVGLAVAGWLSGRRVEPAGSPPEHGEGPAPNVLLITMDTVRAQNTSLCGYQRDTTPHLAGLAAQGTEFEWAIAPAPWTLPTHGTLFTGQFPDVHGADWLQPLSASLPTLAEALSEHGYETGGFVGNLNYCCEEVGVSRGFTHYEDYPLSPGQVVLSTALGRAVTNSAAVRGWIGWHDNLNRKTADDLNRHLLSWLSDVGGQPWFAFVNYYDAHQPYLPPPEFAAKYGEPLPHVGYRYDTNLIEIADWYALSREQVQNEENAYDAAISYLDDRIGQLLDTLRGRGLLDNTLVIITSDHGEQFGEHDLYNHGNSLYIQSVHVPLLVLLPDGAHAGTVVQQAVSLRDLPATILDVAGIEHGLGGRSLARLWQGGTTGDTGDPDVMLSEVHVLEGGRRAPKTRSLVAGMLHYIQNGDGSSELFDLATDPLERHDLAPLPKSKAALSSFEKALKLVLEREPAGN